MLGFLSPFPEEVQRQCILMLGMDQQKLALLQPHSERCTRRCGQHLPTRWLVWKGLKASYGSLATIPSICISLGKWCHTPAMHMQTVNTSPTLTPSLPLQIMTSCRTLSSPTAKRAGLWNTEGLMLIAVKQIEVLYHQTVYSFAFIDYFLPFLESWRGNWNKS